MRVVPGDDRHPDEISVINFSLAEIRDPTLANEPAGFIDAAVPSGRLERHAQIHRARLKRMKRIPQMVAMTPRTIG